MSIEKEEIERDARRYGAEDGTKVRRMKDELDTVERDALGAMPKGPAAFYAAAPPTASFPDVYTPPAARFAEDVDRSVAKQDMAASGVPNIDDESTWPSQWGKQPALPAAARRSGTVMNLDEPPPPPLMGNMDQPVKGSVPTASFPRDDPWGALGTKGQAQAYQMMGFGNEANQPTPQWQPGPVDERTAYLEGLAPELRTDEYMRLSQEQPQGPSGPAAAYAQPQGPPVPLWATRREAMSMQPGVQAQRRHPFNAFQLNQGIPEITAAYANAVREYK